MTVAMRVQQRMALLIFFLLISALTGSPSRTPDGSVRRQKHQYEIDLDKERSAHREANSAVDRAQFLLQESVRVLQGSHAVSKYLGEKGKSNRSRSRAITVTTKSQALRMQVLHKNIEADYENIAGGQTTAAMMIHVISKARKVLQKLRNGLEASKGSMKRSETSKHKLLKQIQDEVVSATSRKSVGQVEKEYEKSLASVLHAYHEMKVLDDRRDAVTVLGSQGPSPLNTELEHSLDTVQRMRSMLKKTLSLVKERGGAYKNRKSRGTLEVVEKKFTKVKAALSNQVKRLTDALMMTQASQRRLLDSVAELEVRMDNLKRQQADRRARLERLHEKSLHLQSKLSTLQPA